MQYEDKDVLSLLRYGSPFAGDIPKCETFEEPYKPYMLTMSQLLREAPTRNRAILSSCKSTGDPAVDPIVAGETG